MKTKKKYQEGGSITQKAAERKSAKGKGTISYKYGDNNAPGSAGNKGKYIPFTAAGRKDAKTKGMVSSKDMKQSKPIKKSGGTVMRKK